MKALLFILLALVLFASCGPTETANFRAKQYFYNSRSKHWTVSAYMEIVKADANFAVGDTISTGRDETYILISKLPILAH